MLPALLVRGSWATRWVVVSCIWAYTACNVAGRLVAAMLTETEAMGCWPGGRRDA